MCVSKNWRYLLNISWWTLTESRWSGMEISPFWEPIHDAAFMATNCHSTCCSILQPYNQIRARRVTHTDPSTCVQTIIHCICNWTQSSLSHYFIRFLTCAGFWLVSSSSVFPNTSASVASRSQQPDAFWRETSWRRVAFGGSRGAEHTHIHTHTHTHTCIKREKPTGVHLLVAFKNST